MRQKGFVESRLVSGVATQLQANIERLFEPSHRRVIILAGATGVGKTAISLQLAAKIGGEIISADSMQVYRGMDIGTAKPSKEEMAKIPHHLIDVCDVTEVFHVVQFYEHAKAACSDILLRGKVPIVVGGTGFYIHALLYGTPKGPPSDLAVRTRLTKEYEKFGLEALTEKLSAIDPIYAATITKNDVHKVIRALEIIEVSGQPVSSFAWKEREVEPFFDWRCWFLWLPKLRLYELLDKRCDAMLQKGLLEEVVALDRQGIRKNPTASQAIGYKQSLEFLDSAQTPADYDKFVQEFKQASRHLAKRQFTWFKKEKLFNWLDLAAHERDEVLDMIIEDWRNPGSVQMLPQE